ncbi:hypothetical protein [uncultured Nostoc sp.]|nr:hypothetical protein [uncultured Nostoc sp.]
MQLQFLQNFMAEREIIQEIIFRESVLSEAELLKQVEQAPVYPSNPS